MSTQQSILSWCETYSVHHRRLTFDRVPTGSVEAELEEAKRLLSRNANIGGPPPQEQRWQLRTSEEVKPGGLLAIVPLRGCFTRESLIATRAGAPVLPSFERVKTMLRKHSIFGAARLTWLGAAGACCVVDKRNPMGEFLMTLPQLLPSRENDRGSGSMQPDDRPKSVLFAPPTGSQGNQRQRAEVAATHQQDLQRVGFLLDESVALVAEEMRARAKKASFTGALPSEALIRLVAEGCLHHHVMLPKGCHPSSPHSVNSLVETVEKDTHDEEDGVQVPFYPGLVPLISTGVASATSQRAANCILYTCESTESAVNNGFVKVISGNRVDGEEEELVQVLGAGGDCGTFGSAASNRVVVLAAARAIDAHEPLSLYHEAKFNLSSIRSQR